MNKRQGILSVIESQDFVILDTETTGLRSSAEICSVAVIRPNGVPLLNTLVKPVCPIPPDATHIHGITNEMVQEAEGFPLEKLYNLLNGQNVIVYNADYDQGMLYKSVDAAGLVTVDWAGIASWFCAMQAFAEIYGDWNDYHHSYRWQKLATACRYYDIPVEGAHGALADCRMTLEVCKAMLKVNP